VAPSTSALYPPARRGRPIVTRVLVGARPTPRAPNRSSPSTLIGPLAPPRLRRSVCIAKFPCQFRGRPFRMSGRWARPSCSGPPIVIKNPIQSRPCPPPHPWIFFTVSTKVGWRSRPTCDFPPSPADPFRLTDTYRVLAFFPPFGARPPSSGLTASIGIEQCAPLRGQPCCFCGHCRPSLPREGGPSGGSGKANWRPCLFPSPGARSPTVPYSVPWWPRDPPGPAAPTCIVPHLSPENFGHGGLPHRLRPFGGLNLPFALLFPCRCPPAAAIPFPQTKAADVVGLPTLGWARWGSPGIPEGPPPRTPAHESPDNVSVSKPQLR